MRNARPCFAPLVLENASSWLPFQPTNAMSQSKVPKEQFKFPILEVGEIVEQCKTVPWQPGCAPVPPVSPDDLSHPTSLRVQHIYSCWLYYLVRITLEDITTAVNERLDLMDNPVRPSACARVCVVEPASHVLICAHQDLHREALFIGMFQMTMCVLPARPVASVGRLTRPSAAACRDQLMLRTTVDVFSVSDLIAPTPLPLMRNLSALINFSLFEREQADEYLMPLLAEDEGLQTRSEALLVANEELTERLAQERSACLISAAVGPQLTAVVTGRQGDTTSPRRRPRRNASSRCANNSPKSRTSRS